jgi:membrane protease YdiL (CAAX protease family)
MLAACSIWAQTPADELPDIYEKILNQEMLTAILMVVGAVKLLRNLINVKGVFAVILTIGASFIYGLIQFGFGANGLVYGLVVGGFSALSFYLTKNLGTVSGAFALGNTEGKNAVYNKAMIFLKIFSDPKNLFADLCKIVKFVFFRR